MNSNIGKIRDILELDDPIQEDGEQEFFQAPQTLSATENDVPLDPELSEDFDKNFTQHSFASHPLSKLAIVGVGTLAAVSTLVLIYSLTQSPKESTNLVEEKRKEDAELLAEKPTEEKNEKDELLAQLALSEQNKRLRESQKASQQPKSEESVEEPVKEAPKQRSTTQAPVRRTPRRRTQTQQVSRREPTTPTREQPRTASQPNRKPQQVRQRPKREVDPNKRWSELAQVGSFKAKGGAEPLELGTDYNDTAQQEEGLLVASNEGIIIGPYLETQSVYGQVIGGTAVAGRSRREVNTVAILLTEPLTDTDGNIVVPEGATLIAEATFNSRVVSFTPLTLSFENEDGYQEVALQGNEITVTGQRGPVIATRREISEDEGFDWATMGQMATAVGGLADVEGATELSILIGAANGNRTRRRPTRPIEMYLLEDGTEVMVRVLRPIPVPIDNYTDSYTETTEDPLPEFDFDY